MMICSSIRYAAALLGIVTACLIAGGCADQSPGIPLEEYAVYDVLFSLPIPDSTGYFVVRDSTWIRADLALTDSLAGVLSREWEMALPPTLMLDFRAKNEKPHLLLEDRFNAATEVKLITYSEYRTLFADGTFRWFLFDERFPTAAGRVWVSRVGFNREQDQALLFFSFYRGPLHGSTKYMLFEKQGTQWKPHRRRLMTIS